MASFPPLPPARQTQHLKRLIFAVICTLVAHIPGLARATEEPEGSIDKTLSPYFFVEGTDDASGTLPLASTTVRVDVSGIIAHVEVEQVYQNTGKVPLNARYVFPASTRAAVHGLTMRVGDRLVRAKIKEREAARAEYEAAKAAGKTATLLEQDRPNVFSMGLSNVMPGDRIDVTLSYTELLVPEAGVYEFVFPTVVGPRYSNQPAVNAAPTDQFIASPYLHAGKAPKHAFALSGTVRSAFPIKGLAARGHEIQANFTEPRSVEFSLAAKEKSGANRDFILRYELAGAAIETGLSTFEAPSGEKFFLAVVQAPKQIVPASIPAREFVFVLDVSGSMHGFPLDTAKVLMRDLVKGLRPQDTFNILYFSGGSELWSSESKSATEANLRDALAFMENIQGAGGTELLPALKRALALPAERNRSRSFIVVTDGYIGAEAEVFSHIRDQLGRANVYAFGIGSSVNRYLVEGIARAGQGLPFVVTSPAEAPLLSSRFRQYIQAPALTHVQATFEGLDAYDVEPRTLPDVLADRPVVLTGKWRGMRAGNVVVRGQTGSGKFETRLALAQAVREGAGSALPYLWARTAIGNATDFPGAPISDADRTKVLNLGLKYNLLTEFTSFIAVLEQTRNPGGQAQDVAQPSALPLGVSDFAVGGAVVGADEPPFVWLLAAILLLAMGLLLRNKELA